MGCVKKQSCWANFRGINYTILPINSTFLKLELSFKTSDQQKNEYLGKKIYILEPGAFSDNQFCENCRATPQFLWSNCKKRRLQMIS